MSGRRTRMLRRVCNNIPEYYGRRRGGEHANVNRFVKRFWRVHKRAPSLREVYEFA